MKFCVHLLLVLLILPCGAVPPSKSGIVWASDQLLPVFAECESLDVIDLQRSPGEIRLLMASLQGLVNRQVPRIYLLEGVEEGARTWLDTIGLPSEDHADPLELIQRYRDAIAGLIIYDPQLADSVNVATTLAGQRDALVASPELAGRLAAPPFDLPVIEDLRGRFKDKLEAYTWQFEQLWPKSNQRLLVGLPPGREGRTRSGLPLGYQIIAADETRERQARNRKVYALDLSSQLGRGFRFADGDRHFTYRFVVPEGAARLSASVDMHNQFRVSAGKVEARMPWRPTGNLRDYAVANRAMVFWLDANAPAERVLLERILVAAGPGTPYFGWFANNVEGEFGAVELASRHAVYVVPSDWFNNLSVFSGTRATPVAQRSRPAAPELESRIYVTFTFGEGDNLQYNQHRMRRLWDDPARGKVPINWTSSPLLLDAAPAILDYYQRTATENDLLIAGPSSVGYFYPQAWPDDQLASFLKRTRPYAERSGMTIPYVLNRVNHRNVPLSQGTAAAYRDQHAVPGILLGWGETFGLEVIGGVPVSKMRGVSSVEEGVEVLADARKQWDGQSPRFLSVGLFAWRLDPSDVVQIVNSLGAEFEVVTADQYFSLIRRSRE